MKWHPPKQSFSIAAKLIVPHVLFFLALVFALSGVVLCQVTRPSKQEAAFWNWQGRNNGIIMIESDKKDASVDYEIELL